MKRGIANNRDKTILPLRPRWVRAGEARGDRSDLRSENNSGSRARFLVHLNEWQVVIVNHLLTAGAHVSAHEQQ